VQGSFRDELRPAVGGMLGGRFVFSLRARQRYRYLRQVDRQVLLAIPAYLIKMRPAA
jgi:hypothetical protein